MKRSEIKARAARYPRFVDWREEDGCFVGTCPGLMYGGVHGDDKAKVYVELCQAVEEVIEVLNTDGHPLPQTLSDKKFSGKFVVRVEPALHRRLALKARPAGESLSNYCTKALVKA